MYPWEIRQLDGQTVDWATIQNIIQSDSVSDAIKMPVKYGRFLYSIQLDSGPLVRVYVQI